MNNLECLRLWLSFRNGAELQKSLLSIEWRETFKHLGHGGMVLVAGILQLERLDWE